RVVSDTDLHGKDVLEVGCGRGGGAAFIAESYAPRSMIGVDLAESAVAFCRLRHRLPGLSFFKGDAENLPFPAATFDVVVNVESSHNYPDMDRFLQEVARVLRPGGSFLIADNRPKQRMPLLQDQLRRSGLSLIKEEQIGPNVVRALELDAE